MGGTFLCSVLITASLHGSKRSLLVKGGREGVCSLSVSLLCLDWRLFALFCGELDCRIELNYYRYLVANAQLLCLISLHASVVCW
jgi:hypothetical protein